MQEVFTVSADSGLKARSFENLSVKVKIRSQKEVLEKKYLGWKGSYEEFVMLNEKEMHKLSNLQQELLFIEELLRE